MTVTHFTCANCKRIRPIEERADERAVCDDREACQVAVVAWQAQHPAPVGKYPYRRMFA